MLVLAAGAAAGFAWASHTVTSGPRTVPPGVTVEGSDIGGMDATAAAEAILERFDPNLPSESLRARVETATYELDVSGILSVDATGVVEDALALGDSADLIERLGWEFLDGTLDVDLPLRLRLDDAAIQTWIEDIASQVETDAVDATRTVDPYRGVFEVQEAREGKRIDERRCFLLVRDALLAGRTDIELPVEVVEPSRTAESLGLIIHVDLSERRLYLYDGTELVKTYGVAVGTPAHPTPVGEWKIIQKRYMPSWGNPGSPWAANMPDYIPPGPSNPLGTRALNLDASGIRIHGTTQDWSIGHAASHGCMRMHRWDVEDLYDRVEVGTPVIITY
ncbi:MAG: hypothetical protein Kow0056_16740 [Coriobacteriia bacterium]